MLEEGLLSDVKIKSPTRVAADLHAIGKLGGIYLNILPCLMVNPKPGFATSVLLQIERGALLGGHILQ